MSPAVRRLFSAVAALLVLAAGVAGLMRGASPVAPTDGVDAAKVQPERARLAALQVETFEFFRQGRGEPVAAGRGLFETDFFKPPPAPPPKPKPKPPETREVAVFYRGLAAFPGQPGVAYLAVDGKTATYEPGAAVLNGWTLAEFTPEQAVLAKGDERLALPFNRRAALTVPVAAQP